MSESEHPALDLMYRMARRAAELADMKMDRLRDIHGSDDTKADRRRECAGMTKGQLVEAILADEFEHDFERLDSGL